MAQDADGHACGMIPSLLGGQQTTDHNGTDNRLDQTGGRYDDNWDYSNNCPKDD